MKVEYVGMSLDSDDLTKAFGIDGNTLEVVPLNTLIATPRKRKKLSSSSQSDTSPAYTTSMTRNSKSKKKQKTHSGSGSGSDLETMSCVSPAASPAASVAAVIDEPPLPKSVQGALEEINKKLESLATKDHVNRLIESLQHKLEKADSQVYDLNKQNDGLQNQLAALKEENKELVAQIAVQKELINQNAKALNDLEQYGRRQHLRVFGVPEPRGQNEKETAKDCKAKVAKIIKDQVGLDLGANCIDIAHRTGSVETARNNQRVRPIIVRFHAREDRDTVLAQRRNLKGKKISIGEDLTYINFKILKRLDNDPRTQSSWSSRGNLFAKLNNGVILKFDMTSDIDKTIAEGLKRGRNGTERVQEAEMES